MQDIRTLSLNELSTFFLSCGEKSFRAKQVYEWLWKKNVVDFESMNIQQERGDYGKSDC